jgi:phospho-N-acetylmuramoyl-pentapeptide-transferase
MLYDLLFPLRDAFGPFNLFRYITFRAAVAGGLAILLTLALGPVIIRFARRLKVGQNIREEVPDRHKTKAGTPTMGGLLILAAAIIGTVLFADLRSRSVQLGLLTLFWLGALGFVDDYVKVRLGKPRGVSKTVKIVGQLGLALIVGAVLYFLPVDPVNKSRTNVLLFKNIVVQFDWFYIPFVMFVMLSGSNAVNLSDGLDGLAAGLLSISLGAYGLLCYAAGNFKLASYLNIMYVPAAAEMTVLCVAVTGACLGFLWYNAHPAEIFMGDTGSLPLGGLLGLAAVVCKHEMLLPLIGGVFVLEAGSVLLQVAHFRVTKGGRLFKMAPLHHHYELKGWPEPKIVTRFLILGVLFALAALATLKVR